jgi:hypothetical protein
MNMKEIAAIWEKPLPKKKIFVEDSNSLRHIIEKAHAKEVNDIKRAVSRIKDGVPICISVRYHENDTKSYLVSSTGSDSPDRTAHIRPSIGTIFFHEYDPHNPSGRQVFHNRNAESYEHAEEMAVEWVANGNYPKGTKHGNGMPERERR